MTQETPLTLWLTLRNIKLRRNNTSCHSNGESQFQWIKDWILFWNNLYLSSTGEQNCQTFSIPVVYTMNEWTCSYNDTVIIIKHTSLDFTSFWTSAWLCKSCQQVNCQLCLWQNCDSSGRQSELQSDALRLNALPFIPRSNHNFKFKEWPTSFVSCPQLILDKSSSTFNA